MKFIITILLFSQVLFSQTQIIVKKFDWKIYKTEHFDIYYYKDSEKLLDYASYLLEKAYEKGKKEFNPLLEKRIPFFLFASQNDIQQNSIIELGDGTGGVTEPYKDRFMAYSDGSKMWLRDVIFHEFGHEIQFSILVDSWWESPRILKTILYPLWMMEGMSENMTGDWDLAMEDMYVRDAVVDGKLIPLIKLFGFGHLKPHQTTLAYKTGAKAMKFLAEEYGKDKPSLMLHYYRDAYDINNVLNKLIGIDIDKFDEKFKNYLEIKYFNQIKRENMFEAETYGKKLNIEANDDIPVFNTSPVVISKDKIAYISTFWGHPPSIIIEDLITRRKKIINAQDIGIDNIPYSRFTLLVNSLSISNDKKYLVFSGQKNHKEYLCVYDLENNKFKKILFEDLIEARLFSFSPDDKKLIFVGMDEGENQLFELDFRSTISQKKLKKTDLVRLTFDSSDKLSPKYIDDNKIIYLCETGYFDDLKRDICVLDKNRNIKRVSTPFNIVDITYDKTGKNIYFISDFKNNYNLYSISIESGKIYRHTNVIGGVFTPFAEEGNVYFSYFRHGLMNIYQTGGLFFEWVLVGEVKFEDFFLHENKKEVNGEFKEYKFNASTDLFFPALLYSSPGGLFLFTYWQASDMLSRHNLSFYISYNSAYPYLNTNISYLYNRYRTKFLLISDIYDFSNIDDINIDEKYDKRYIKTLSGFLYPFDRYKSLGIYLSHKDEIKEYNSLNLKYEERKRGFILSYLDNNINGLYLTAVYGYKFNVVISHYDDIFNGNIRYDTLSLDYVKYFPLSRKSAIVNRVFLGFSEGRDNPDYSYGGVGGIRGFIDNSTNESKNVAVYNIESRFPLLKMDYYLYYIFPDFYFKSIYFKLFSDNAYGWNKSFNPSIGNIKNSIGFGLDIYAFILQSYKILISLDWSFNTKTGTRVAYFYIGPLF
ncbi:MAG: hypothetical protein K6357_00810 [Elusimicrobiota bacterium]